jgi:lysozyme
MKTNDEGVTLIKRWEGHKTKAYKDGGGVWTIGYGHTSAAGGLKVTPGLVITEQQAEEILKSDLGKFEARVEKFVKVPLNENQFAALVSFDFNTGALDKSTLLKKLNAGNYAAVPSELMKWVNDNGKRIQGLVNRRTDEAKLWNKPTVKAPEKPVQTETEVLSPTVPKEEKRSVWVVILEILLALLKRK